MGNLLASSRMVYAFGRDGYFPSSVGRITHRHHVPLIAVFLHALFAFALALLGNFEWLILVSGGANCLVYVVVCVSAWRLQRIGRAEQGTPFELPGGATIPVIAVLFMVAVLATLTGKEWVAIGAALLVLVAVYGVLAALRARRGPT
jgi:amino acid transporter